MSTESKNDPKVKFREALKNKGQGKRHMEIEKKSDSKIQRSQPRVSAPKIIRRHSGSN